eukprot:TRINITY_DN10208_c0_g1_i1.p1 TRINITY_DN10208_c0_g1~~TRINITY_DN10208_c0_g1_i1.p1  ORF type:complete len:327 (+),score=52.78 TRINITY_DN10208_c0_g1_i1:78-983(+)
MEWRTVQYDNQSTFTGYTDEGMKRQKVGCLKLASGDKYIGQWNEGMMTGLGKYSFKSGDEYCGELEEGQFNGNGFINNFIGGYVGNKKHGQGTAITSDHVLTQTWKHGRLSASAKSTFLEHAKSLDLRATLLVKFTNIFPHQSPETEADYTAELTTKEHCYPSKCVYTGSFFGTKKTGFGKWSHPDGDTYIGYWIDNCKEGWGTYKTSPEKYYSGLWKEDKMSGWGVYYLSATEYYVSEFVADRKSGSALFHKEGEPSMYQIWSSGKLISEKEATENEIAEFEEVRTYISQKCETIENQNT